MPRTFSESRQNISSILSMFNRGSRVPSSMSFSRRIASTLALTVVNGALSQLLAYCNAALAYGGGD